MADKVTRRMDAIRSSGVESVAGASVADWMERFAQSDMEKELFWESAKTMKEAKARAKAVADAKAERAKHARYVQLARYYAKKAAESSRASVEAHRTQRMMELAQRARVA